MRPTGWQIWLEVAEVIAKRSQCVRAQVGCVIVDERNRVVATGYNGPPAGFRVSGPCSGWCKRGELGPTAETQASYEDCYTIHAEMNALLYVDRSRCENGFLFVTGAVCYSCAKAIANSGVTRVLMLETEQDEARDPERSIRLLTHSGLQVYTAWWNEDELIIREQGNDLL